MQTQGQIQFTPQVAGNNWTHLQTEEEKAERQSFEESADLEKSQERLEKLVESTNQFCFSIKTHKLIDFFPNYLIIDIHKVTMITQHLLSKDLLSIPVKDLNKVEVYNDFWAASMELVNGSQTTTISINWLKKDEARQAQAILQGLMIANKNALHIEDFPPEQILDKLLVLGSPVA